MRALYGPIPDLATLADRLEQAGDTITRGPTQIERVSPIRGRAAKMWIQWLSGRGLVIVQQSHPSILPRNQKADLAVALLQQNATLPVPGFALVGDQVHMRTALWCDSTTGSVRGEDLGDAMATLIHHLENLDFAKLVPPSPAPKPAHRASDEAEPWWAADPEEPD